MSKEDSGHQGKEYVFIAFACENSAFYRGFFDCHLGSDTYIDHSTGDCILS